MKSCEAREMFGQMCRLMPRQCHFVLQMRDWPEEDLSDTQIMTVEGCKKTARAKKIAETRLALAKEKGVLKLPPVFDQNDLEIFRAVVLEVIENTRGLQNPDVNG